MQEKSFKFCSQITNTLFPCEVENFGVLVC